MSVEGQVQIRMRASVGTLRSQGVYWVEEARAAKLVEGLYASYLAEPGPVDIVGAVTAVAAEMRDGHKLAPQQPQEGVQADGAKSDQGAGKARPRRRARDGDGGSDPAGRLDQPDDREQG